MQSILSASLFVSISGILSLFGGFVSSIIIARVLGAEGTGITALALWVGMTGAIVASMGIPAVLLRYISRQDDTAEARNGLVNLLYGRFLWPVLLVSGLFLGYAVHVYNSAGLNSALVWAIAGAVWFPLRPRAFCHRGRSRPGRFLQDRAKDGDRLRLADTGHTARRGVHGPGGCHGRLPAALRTAGYRAEGL